MDFTVENADTTIACREYAGVDVSSDAPALVCVHGACVDGGVLVSPDIGEQDFPREGFSPALQHQAQELK